MRTENGLTGSANSRSLNTRDSSVSSLVRPSVSAPITPCITANGVANVTLALTVSVVLGAIAIVTDILGYLILSEAKGGKIKSKAVTDFAFIPELGSTAFGVLVLLGLMYSGAFSRMMRNENTQCTRVLMWCMVAANFIINTALGFAGDHLFNHDQHADLIQECLWSKLVSLGLLGVVGGLTIVLGGEKVIVDQLWCLYDFTQREVDKKIGPGTEFYEAGGCCGAWCMTFSRRNGSDDATAALLPSDKSTILDQP